ncbi:26S proteasome regulatory complex, subunit PSMD5 [Guillardia theta CCMP2712]|uniref:26S proteasome regulatory complex, subunit PSMD5 n=1 Tax=Guillardia theta (strain CCMP2712) TaxID=905079 RepID=L1JI04_GUITC|nr:26S proteasome regulatory complex, subunit PSMD5 [Guillardia theta CCMP2712]EKX47942.1 26S proteasome regulatory complex, subunit PSMD5 [Guillardia theta CCMP2712]|eukprot:XP_005834922.1 26S proteasome regulatory complex, subunit PSMD5 [Guillardia theta CCMP2712]
MAIDIAAKLQDFDRLPATAESKSALLAAVPLPKLLELLNDANHVELVSKCLNKLFSESSQEDLNVLKQQGSELFPLGLQHPSDVVRKSTIKLVEKLMGNEGDLLWLQERDIVFLLVKMLSDESIQMSSAASSALLRAVGQPSGVRVVFNERHVAHMSKIICDREQAVVAFRVLEFICTAWRRREDETEVFKSTGAKDQLVAIIHSDDILLQLNAVEVIALLPSHEIGKELLVHLLQVAESTLGSGAVPARLLEACARFLAGEVESSAELEGRFCETVSQRARGESSSVQEQVDMLNVLSVLSSSPRGLKILVRSKTLPSVCRGVSSNLKSQQSDLKLATLSLCVEAIRSAKFAEEEGEAASTIFAEGLGDVMEPLIKLAKCPIQEEKVGAICMFKSMAHHAWGVKKLFSHGDFLAFLLDRKAESSKRALDEKFEVAKLVLSHPQTSEILGAGQVEMISNFVANGAYYTQQGAGGNLMPNVGTMAL